MKPAYPWLALLLACGGTTSSQMDAGTDVTTQDAAPDVTPPCDLTKAFGAPLALNELNVVGDDVVGARLTHDELTVYFTRSPSGDVVLDGGVPTHYVYAATRPTVADTFGNVTLLASLDTPGTRDVDPSPTGDELAIYFASQRSDSGAYTNLYFATRATPSGDFTSVAPVAGIGTATSMYNPFIMPDGLTLYFASAGDLFRATRSDPSQPFVLDSSNVFSSINDPSSSEEYPTVTLDELTVYFSSDRGGQADIYVSKRTSIAEPFGTPALVTELDTKVQNTATGQLSNDYPSWISDDGCRLYMSSDRQKGYTFAFVATKPAP